MSGLAASLAWSASALAQHLGQFDDESIGQALLLLISRRPELQGYLLEHLQEPPPPRYTGRIQSFWVDKKYGFIQCDELMNEFNSDVFLSDQEIGSFAVGSTVSFSVMLNKDGKPQAKLLDVVDGGGGEPADTVAWARPPFEETQAVHPPAKARKLSPAAPVVVPARVPPVAQVPVPPPRPSRSPAAPLPDAAQALDDPCAWRWQGTITKFFPDKCYGFIQSDGLKELFGVDVFLSDQQIGEFQVGNTVSFEITLNKDGKPQACGLEAATSEEEIQNGEEEFQDGARHTGTIKSFFPGKRYGFIQCDLLAQKFGGDVFLSDMQLQSFTVGDNVSFAVAYNAQDRPQARDLQAAVY